MVLRNSIRINPAKSVEGRVSLPGDKSISHRAAILGALATGELSIKNFSASNDCSMTIQCLQDLGVEIIKAADTVRIKSKGKSRFAPPGKPLDCGNSGTTMRLLAGVLAGRGFESMLTGDGSLSRRPMNRIIEPLKQMGAKIDSAKGNAPLRIIGQRKLRPISYDLQVPSAQVKSALLIAGLSAEGVTRITCPPGNERFPLTRNHTELMLEYLGARIENRFIETPAGFSEEISVDGRSEILAKDLVVPGDISSAAFFIVAACLLDDSNIELMRVGLNPTRTRLFRILEESGARIDIVNKKKINNEEIGDIRITYSGLVKTGGGPLKIDGDLVPGVIDEIPILAIFGTQLESGLEVRDAQELRNKESDRIRNVVLNLKSMGAKVAEFDDGFRVEKSTLRGARVQSFGDHRVAMAFAVAALVATGPTEIVGFECVNVSFPNFFEELQNLVK